ncbi:MAG: hypothetical protein A2804_01680 [Candidatus Pacebacteria bacterium RIFCSPHIGHO2_01_FULL_46_10]|nr:MAG: hypothetical protein A2804_01680 [Candidatus Pacebacteria bacterium RIFCSPHIGHO2_01_FULL_46_10]
MTDYSSVYHVPMPITTLLFDLAHVLLFPRDKTYTEKLSALHKAVKHAPTYYFPNFFEFNEELLKFLERECKNKVRLAIFTTGTIHQAPEVAARFLPLFSHIYSSAETGLSKKDLASYLYIAKDLRKTPSEMFFTDDTQENIGAAQAAGFHAVRYESNAQIMQEIESLNS